MSDTDAFAALDAMVLLAEGNDDLLVLESDTPVARRRDMATLTSSSKKMRLSASLPRFGMNLRLRLARHVAVS